MADRLFAVPPEMNERDWQSVLQKGLTREGFLWNHVYRMRTASGAWRTSTTSTGWPDLVAVHPGTGWVLGIECKKAPKDLPKPDQIEWLEAFAQIPTGRAWCLRPGDDWQMVANWLHDPEHAPRTYGWNPAPATPLR